MEIHCHWSCFLFSPLLKINYKKIIIIKKNSPGKATLGVNPDGKGSRMWSPTAFKLCPEELQNFGNCREENMRVLSLFH